MALPPERAYQLAAAALQAVVQHYADESEDLPARQFASDGEVAWDCEFVAVRVVRIYAGTPDAEIVGSLNCPLTLTAVLGLSVARCVPTMGEQGTPPSASEIDASAQVVLKDPLLLYAALREAQKAGDLAGCSGLAYEQWVAIGPSGGMSGGELTVRVLLTS
jgi:hypothetical protein